MTLRINIPKHEKRSIEQIRDHYEVEKRLAKKLMNSQKSERKYLYHDLYNELFTRVPHHSRWTRQSSPEITDWIVSKRMELIKRFLTPETTFLEIGAGDCSLSFEISKYVKQVYAVDIVADITQNAVYPQNFKFVLSDGCSIDVPKNTIDIAYSHQLMEHLHPGDAIDQLQHIYHALAPQGIYICITPNRLSGPHDISKYFDEVATGFHLKEYTVTELYRLFRDAGFSKISWAKSDRNRHLEIPLTSVSLPLLRLTETLLDQFPYTLRRKIANTPLLFRGTTIIGMK